jgi:serine/threonine-protein kinase
LKTQSPATPTANTRVKQPFVAKSLAQSNALTFEEKVPTLQEIVPASQESVPTLQEIVTTPEESGSLIGVTLDQKYRLESKLGIGGMGSVYRAHRLLIGDTVAVKVLHPNQMSYPQAVERFRREAQTAARVKHPNVANVYDFGVSKDGLIYQVMELVEGESLRQVIEKEGSINEATAAKIIFQVCAALDEAHKQGVVHRDIKPENILVRKTRRGWQVKVLDFGIASQSEAPTERITIAGSVVGTPHYMSPEQCLGEELDGRSDIYNLGVVLFEMLTGVAPFNSPTPTAIVIQQVNQAPPRLRSVNPKISPAVETVVLSALEKQREARPQTASQFAKELIAAVKGVAIVPLPQAIDTLGTEASPTNKVLPAKVTVAGDDRNALSAKTTSTTVKKFPTIRASNKVVLMLVTMFITMVIGAGGLLLYKQKNGFVLAANENYPVKDGQQTSATINQPAAVHQQNTSNSNAIGPVAGKSLPTSDNAWGVISEQTIDTTDAANVSGQSDQQMAIIKPGGQLALFYQAGAFFREGRGDDLRIFAPNQERVSYAVFVRVSSTCAWKRIDTNRRGFPSGVASHDMGHHGVRLARQLLIKNTGATDLSIDAGTVLHKDDVAAEVQSGQ